MYGRRKGRTWERLHGGYTRHDQRLANGLLWRLNDPRDRAAPSEVTHACPPLDPCAGSDAGDAMKAIGPITAAGRAYRRRHRRPSSNFSSLNFHVELRRNKYQQTVRIARLSKF